MNIFDHSPSGYRVQEPQAADRDLAELRDLGISRPVQPGDGLDESMPPDSLRVIVQIGCEMLAKHAGAETGDPVTAEVVNRGLLDYMRERQAAERRAQRRASTEGAA